ncbi:uncharacterized protein TNCV_545351 [Trichonephila clavipes]|nr:uncharacterized protein TNCV_545351 [Trichonephila clavipes]
MLGLTRQGVIRLFPHCYHPFLSCSIPGFVSNRAYLGSFGTTSSASYEFERTRGKLSSDLFSVWFGNSSNDHQARRRFVEWAQNEIAVVPDFHKRILFSDEAPFWLNGYVNKQNCRIRSEANPQMYVETPLHPEKLTVWCALWAGEILLQKR